MLWKSLCCFWQKHQCEMKKWKTSLFLQSFYFCVFLFLEMHHNLEKQRHVSRYRAKVMCFQSFSHASMMNVVLYKQTQWYGTGWAHSAPLPPVWVQPATTTPLSSSRTRRNYRIDTCSAESTRQDLGQSQSNRRGCASSATWTSLFDRWWKSCIVYWAAVKEISRLTRGWGSSFPCQ